MTRTARKPELYVDMGIKRTLHDSNKSAVVRLYDYKGYVMLHVDGNDKSDDQKAKNRLGIRAQPAWLTVEKIDALIAGLRAARSQTLKSYAFVRRIMAIEAKARRYEKMNGVVAHRRARDLRRQANDLLSAWNKKVGHD